MNRRLLPSIGCALIAACSLLEPRPDPSRFFTLTPTVSAAGGQTANASIGTLGIGPLTFPRYLDRPEIVTRIGPNEVRHATSDYWAGSLAKQFETTLEQNLEALVSPSSIVVYPWYAAAPPDAAVEIEVVQFERTIDGEARLVARWRVKSGRDGKVIHAAESSFARPAAGDPASTAAALSELLGDLSREMAEALRRCDAYGVSSATVR